jgi:hypothetical protein
MYGEIDNGKLCAGNAMYKTIFIVLFLKVPDL